MAPRKDADYEITIVRAVHDSDNPYFLTRRDVAQNRELSYAARGLLWYLLSRPDDWTVMISDLEQQCGRDKVYSMLTELQEAGHLERNQARAEGGKFGKRGYTVHEVPRPRDAETTQETPKQPLTDLPEAAMPDTAKPSTDLPVTAAPDTANPPLQNTELVQKRDGTEDRKDTSPDGDVPPVAIAPAVTPEPEPKVAEFFQSIAPLAEKSEEPPSSAPPPKASEPTPRASIGDDFYVTADGTNYGPYTNYNAVKDDVAAHGYKQVAVTQVRPDGELVAPTKPGRKPRATKADKPKLTAPPDDVKEFMARMCYGPKFGDLIPRSKAAIVTSWNSLGCPPLEKLPQFERWWYACDWRGQKKQKPTPHQVVSEWDVAMGWDGATVTAQTTYQQNYRSKAELDAERNRINIEKGIEKARQWQAEREAKGGKS